MDIQRFMSENILTISKQALAASLWKPAARRQVWRFLGAQKQARMLRDQNATQGLEVPPFLIASITTTCNLRCKGCYAAVNQPCQSRLLTAERWGEIFAEAKELGVCFILLAGGEPLMRTDVLKQAARYPDIMFPVFTNGTMLEKQIDQFDHCRNLLPILSIEGGKDATDDRRGSGVYDSITGVMRLLKKKKILFGVSLTVTSINLGEITQPSFVQGLKDGGASVFFYVEYVPADGNTQLCIDDVQRIELAQALDGLRHKKKSTIIISFPGDEEALGGCLAAGRGFAHINASGGLEPCPFSPHSDISLIDHSLAEALRSPFFAKLRESGLLTGEHQGGCTLWDRREEVEQMILS